MQDDLIIPPRIAKAVENARLPANCKAAVAAIAKCASIDQCLDWADKFAALASYAKQREDVEPENYCRRIRARASRRCGELLRELDARGAHMKKKEWPHLSRTEAAERAGLSEYQRKTVVQIASIPADEFEAQVESPRPPGTSLLAMLGKQQRAPKKERAQEISSKELNALLERVNWRNAIAALTTLGHSGERVGDVGAFVDALLRGPEQTLSKVREGLVFTRRIDAALKSAGVPNVTHLKPVR